jgi:hypothetical protein
MLFLSLFLCCKYFVLFNVLAKLNLIRISSSVSAAEPPRKVNGVIAINDNHKLDLSNPTEPINVYFAENLLLGCSFTKAESNDEEISENGIIKRDTDYYSDGEDEQANNADYEPSLNDELDESDDENDVKYTWTVNEQFYDQDTYRVQLNYEGLKRLGDKLKFKCERKQNGHSYSFSFPMLNLG